MPALASDALTRLSLLLAVSCLGTGAALVGGRALLERLPLPTPATASTSLEKLRRWSPDPGRRREASLLLHSRFPEDPGLRQALLRGHGWGTDPLAAVVLKNAAKDAEALGQRERALNLWQELQRRFGGSAANADALYALGRSQPALRQELLQRFPAHPAALAAALEAGPDAAARLAGAVHLARWGARWPGAEGLMKRICSGEIQAADGAQRAAIAEGLAQIGSVDASVACLDGTTALKGQAGEGAAAKGARAHQGSAWGDLSNPGRLSLARALLQGDPAQRQRALQLLLTVAGPGGEKGVPSPEAQEAVRLLAQQEGPEAEAALQALPPSWRESAAVVAHRVLADPSGQGGMAVLQRWPKDPASWDLQWELARRQLLASQWRQATSLLEAIPADQLPAALAARQRFWLGYAQQQQGDRKGAIATWRDLRRRNPGGYYGWRAAVQLGEGGFDEHRETSHGQRPTAFAGWDPLGSGDRELDRLWRLDQRTEAWEAWRERRGNRPPREGAELLVEGRLRQGVGDDWTGFGQLEQAALVMRPDQCALLPLLERSLHPPRFVEVLGPLAKQRGVPLALLQGIAKQESRFSPTVHSAAGAVGLMQVLPSTASELAGRPVTPADLEQPARNAELGSLYLQGLLRQWKGNPLAAVASYNAGPGAVQGWINPRLGSAPELWVEGIPYPETRLYVKKVLGNAWTYHNLDDPQC